MANLTPGKNGGRSGDSLAVVDDAVIDDGETKSLSFQIDRGPGLEVGRGCCVQKVEHRHIRSIVTVSITHHRHPN